MIFKYSFNGEFLSSGDIFFGNLLRAIMSTANVSWLESQNSSVPKTIVFQKWKFLHLLSN